MTPRYWLAKSEPETYSIHDLARDGRTHWEGVRNYQARIYLREMQVGDLVLFYHSNADPSGVVGVCRVVRASYPDPSALDPRSDYHDPGATEADPRWVVVDVEHVETWPRAVALAELRGDPALQGMEVTRKGSRLSVSPVKAEHFARVAEMARQPAAEVTQRTEPTAKKKGATKTKPTAKKKKPTAKKKKPTAKKKKPTAKKKTRARSTRSPRR